MKAIVRANQNHAGVYGAVTRTGRLAVGAPIFFRAGAEHGSTSAKARHSSATGA
jgi:hypothetical protein